MLGIRILIDEWKYVASASKRDAVLTTFASVIAVYGLVVSVLIAGGRESLAFPILNAQKLIVTISLVSPSEPYSLFAGFIHLGAGLCEPSAAQLPGKGVLTLSV
jgi:hypothetical protein